MDFFKGVGNFFGGLFGGNKDDEERKRQQQQQAQRQAQQQAQQNQQRSQPQTGFTPSAPTLQPFTPQNNIPNRQNQSNDALNPLIFNKPQQPKPRPVPESITNKISGYHVMSPATQRQAVIDSPEARLDKLNKNIEQRKRNQEGIKEFTSTLGSIPVVSTGANASTWLTSLAGNLTGNKDWQERADNTRNMINIGMTDQELRRLPDAQEGKLRNVSNVASGLSLLDVAGITSVAKAPIIGGAKEAVKKGLTSEAGKSILKKTAKETGKQYGKHIAIGAGVGGVADPALQAYINDGKVDWSSVPSSMLQSGLWAAAIPEFAGKSRLTNKMRAGGRLVHEVDPNAPAIRENSPITPAGENPAQKPSGISSPNRPEGMNKAQNFPTKAEPQPAVTQPVPRPEPQSVQPQPEPAYQTPPQTLQDAIGEPNAQLAPPRPVEPVTAPESPLQPIQRQLDEQMLEPPRPEVVTPPRVVETPAQVQARQVQELNATQPRLTPEQVADINAQKALADAPTEAMAREAQQPTGVRNRKAGLDGTEDYDTALSKLDDAVENGRISYAEAGRLEDELFNGANKRGEAMAQKAGSGIEDPEVKKDYDFVSQSKHFSDNDNIVKTLSELGDNSTPMYKALDLLRMERGIGSVSDELKPASSRLEAKALREKSERTAKSVSDNKDNIMLARAYRSHRRQNSFTAIGADGDSYSVTAQVPKNIKSIGGLVEHLYKNGHTNEANRISKALREMSDRTVLRNQAHAGAKAPAPEPAPKPQVGKTEPHLKADDIGSVFDDPKVQEATNTTNGALKVFGDLRKEYKGDADFMDKVVYENVENQGRLGEIARAIARADATEVGRGYSISEMLDDYLKPLDTPAVAKYNLKVSHLDDLKGELRKLAKDTGQPELYKKAMRAIADMDVESQVDYLAKGLLNARNSGVQAMAHVNKQNNYTPASARTPDVDTPRIDTEAKAPAPQAPKADEAVMAEARKYKSAEEFVPSNSLARKKQRLESEIEKLQNRLNNQNDMPGAYVTGRAGISGTRQRKQFASLERTIDDSKRLNKAIDELNATNNSIDRQRRNALKPKVEKKQTVVADTSKIKVSETDSLILDDYGFSGDKKTQLAKYVEYLDNGGEPRNGLDRINGQYIQTKKQQGVHDSLADNLPNPVDKSIIPEAHTPQPKPVKPVATKPESNLPDDLTAETAQSKRELQELDDILAKEGKTYEDLQGKLYRNEARISGRLSDAEEALTPAEKEALKKLKSITDDSAERLLRNTLNEVDINRRTSYAPAGHVDELDIPKTVEESASGISDADFDKRRGITKDSVMSDKPLSENARRAYERERVNALASERYNRDTLVDVRTQQNLHKDQDVFEGPLKDVKDASPVRLDEKELTTLTKRNNKLANKEADYIEAVREARKSDTPEAAENVNKTHAEVIRSKAEKNVELLDMVDKKFKARDKELALERKTANSARRAEIDKERKSLVDRLEAAHANIHYMQSAIDTNLLLQPRGRLADTIQASTELPSQKLADPLARGFANRSSVKHGGEKVFGNQRRANKLYNELKKEGLIKATRRANLESNIALTKSQKTLGGKISKGYRTVGTAATEFASSEKKPLIDTINILRQRAKNMGMSDKAADNYVRSRVGTQEWDDIHNLNYNVANSFTGVANMGRKSGDIIERALTKADHVTKEAINGIPNLSIGQKQTLSKLIQRVGIGYTRAAYRVTKNSISRSVLGTDSMVRAAMVRGNTPAANMQRAMYVRKAVQDAQIGTGFGVAGMGIGLALGADGRVSGGYPEDKNERARWEREGITPYSIKLGDNWVNFSRYVPQAYVPVMLGGLMGSKDSLTVGDVGGIFQSVLTGAYENTGIAGVVSTLNAITTDPSDSKFKNGITNLVNSTITMLTPGSGLLSTAARATDDVKRDTKDPNALAEIGNKVKVGLPGLRNTLDEKTDTFGEPVKDTKWNALFYVAKGSESSPVTAELNRLHKDAGLEAFPVNNKYEVKDADGNALDLSSSQRRAMDNAVKKEKAQNAEVLMSTDTYKKASDQEKKDMLTKLYSLDSSAVASKWAKDNGIANVKDTAETVNNSLELSDKQAILESKVQGDKKDKWLENNDNAANYYRADYNNAKANNTLTDKDENLNEKAGKKYKMISAQVDKDFGADQELKRLYSAIGSSEIKKYFNLDSDMYNPKLGERLLAFDQVRTDKGVSRNSNFSDRPKYNAVKARGGSRSGSGGKAKGYNLPTSLLSGKSNSAPAIKRGERLFKTPTLVSTAEKTKSRIPNISVKKGIHL